MIYQLKAWFSHLLDTACALLAAFKKLIPDAGLQPAVLGPIQSPGLAPRVGIIQAVGLWWPKKTELVYFQEAVMPLSSGFNFYFITSGDVFG